MIRSDHCKPYSQSQARHPSRTRSLLPLSVHVLLLALVLTLVVSGCVAPASAPYPQDTPVILHPQDQKMKTIGMIGGISWVSSAEYYRMMNHMVQDEYGEQNSAHILLYSIEFGEFSKQERLADEGDWEGLTMIMIDAAERLERGGADCIIICSNTMHSTIPAIEAAVDIPIISIIDETGKRVQEKNITTVGLLGTKKTMSAEFYKERLREEFGLVVLVPDMADQEIVNNVIFDELCVDYINPASKEEYKRIISNLIDEGAEGIILGCTEIPLLIRQEDVDVPIFDTTRIHAEAAVRYALNHTPA